MIIFDTETTGLVGPEALPLEKQPHIVEFSAVKLNDKLEQIDDIDFICNPGIELSPEITKITGLKTDDVKGKPPFGAHMTKLTDFFLGQHTIVAHNCEFDMKMLLLELRRLGKEYHFPWPSQRICTVERTEHIKGFRLNLASLYELSTKGGKFSGAHRAMNDVKALAQCVRWMRKEKLV